MSKIASLQHVHVPGRAFALAVASVLAAPCAALAQPAPQPPAVPPGALPVPSSPVPAPAVASPRPAGKPLSLAEAVRTTLTLHPAIEAARASVARGTAREKGARGPFDPSATADLSHTHEYTPVLPSQQFIPGQDSWVTDTTSLSVGATMATRWGMAITPSVGLSRIHQRDGDGRTIAGATQEPSQQARVNLEVTQHLLRGAGALGAASEITAARLGREAAGHSLIRTAEQRAYLTILAYHELVAATEQLDLLRTTEGNARKVLADTRILVESEQRPRSDLRQLEGNLANRARAVVEAENGRLQARYALALAMGVSATEIADWEPTSGFPADSPMDEGGVREAREAAQSRADVRAARATAESAAAALRGAEWNTRPALDLRASVGYAGALEEDGVGPFFAAAGRNVPGVNAGVGLSLELPFGNAAREAERDLLSAEHTAARVAQKDLERTVPLAVLAARDELRLSRDALAQSTLAAEHFAQAVADQREKLREGAGTVIDSVFVEEQLTSAEIGRTQNRLRAAQARTRLLFETGKLPGKVEQIPTGLSPLTGHEAPGVR